MADGFWTPQCVEAAARRLAEGADYWNVSSHHRSEAGDIIAVALAAKDREEMIEAAAHAIPVGALLYRRRVASAVLAALGLLASPDEKGR